MIQRRTGVRYIAIGGVLIVVVLLLVLFGVVFRGGSNKASSTGSAIASPTAVATGPVVVAAAAIPQGTVIKQGQTLAPYFTVIQMPTAVIPFGAYTSLAQIEAYISSTGCGSTTAAGCTGQVTTSETIFPQEPIVSGMLTNLGEFRVAAGPSFQIPFGYVAIAISLSSLDSVLGSIEPGDDIDLMTSFTGSTSAEKGRSVSASIPTQTQYVMNDLRVLAVGGPPLPPPAPPPPTAVPGTPSVVPTPVTTSVPTVPQSGSGTMIVLVRYQEALVIQHLKDFGATWTMSAVLRSAKETDIPGFRTLPVTFRWFFIKQANHFDLTEPY